MSSRTGTAFPPHANRCSPPRARWTRTWWFSRATATTPGRHNLKDAAGQAVGVEFGVPSVTSTGLEVSHLNVSRQLMADAFVHMVPDLKYAETSHRGYLAVTLDTRPRRRATSSSSARCWRTPSAPLPARRCGCCRAAPIARWCRPPDQSFSVSPWRGCHFISRFSMRPTRPSSTSAKAVSTTMPANTVLTSNVPSACRIR